MPELPEVAEALARLDTMLRGRRLAELRMLHPSLARRVAPAIRDALAGARVARTERRGKHQLVHLDDGRVIHVHFRMSGDWVHGRPDEPHPRHSRALFVLDDATWVALVDPRALATIDVHPAGAPPAIALGPEPQDPSFDLQYLERALRARRGAIKPALLDQRLVAGLGNIYAAEALWRARIDPFRPAQALTRPELRRLLQAMRAVIEDATGARYRARGAPRFAVYDREGEPCRRCRGPIARQVQSGRSTYFCPRCQAPARDAAPARRRVSPSPRRARP